MYDRSSAWLNDVRLHYLAVRAGIRDEGAFIQTEPQKLVEPRAGTASVFFGLERARGANSLVGHGCELLGLQCQ